MGASLARTRASETGQGRAAGRRTGDTRPCFSANSARRAAQLPCIALARYPDRSAFGESPTLPSLPRCRRRRGRLLAATYSVLGPAGRAVARNMVRAVRGEQSEARVRRSVQVARPERSPGLLVMRNSPVRIR